MNQDQAHEIATSLLDKARSESSQSTQIVTARNAVVDRIRTALITMLGLGFGWSTAESWLGQADFAPLIGVVTGLLAAVAFHPRRQT